MLKKTSCCHCDLPPLLLRHTLYGFTFFAECSLLFIPLTQIWGSLLTSHVSQGLDGGRVNIGFPTLLLFPRLVLSSLFRSLQALGNSCSSNHFPQFPTWSCIRYSSHRNQSDLSKNLFKNLIWSCLFPCLRCPKHVHSGFFVSFRSEFKRHLLRKTLLKAPNTSSPTRTITSLHLLFVGNYRHRKWSRFFYNLLFFCFSCLVHMLQKISDLAFNIYCRTSWASNSAWPTESIN